MLGKPKLTRRDALALTATSAALPVAARAAEAPRRGGSLRCNMGTEFIGLDPQGPSSAYDRNFYTSVFNGLVTVDPSLHVIPDLALSWTQPDPKTYVFKLRQGVRFHDGTPFDAAAVKFNFDYILDPKNNSQRRPEIISIDRVDVVDRSTVRITLKNPFAPFLAIIADRAGYMVSPTARQKLGKDMARNPVGTGPFKFVEWQRDDHLRVRRNEEYYDKNLPYLDEIVYRPIVDQSVGLTELRTGNVDFAYSFAIDPKDIPTVRASNSLRFLEAPGVGYEGFQLNVTSGPLANKALREAFSLALDRAIILGIAYSNIGRSANGPFPPSLFPYDQTVPVIKRDVAAAKRKLTEGGRPNGFSMTLRAQGNSPTYAKITQLAQSQLKEVGIDAQIQFSDFATLLRAGDRGDFDALTIGWSGRIDPDGNVEPIFQSKGAFNYGKYNNKEVDALIERGQQEQSQEARKRIYRQIAKLIDADAAYAFTYFRPSFFMSSAAVQGFPLSPDGLMRFKAVWLAK